jgi:ATP-binding cassette subfamily B protein
MVANMKQQSHKVGELPTKLVYFIWRYLKNKKAYLAGFLFIGLIWAIEMTLSPYLLKVIIDAIVQYPQNQTKMLVAVLIPAVIYFSMSIIMNLTFRLHDYLNLRLFPEIYASINKDMFTYLAHHSYTFFQNNFAGNLTKKIFDMCQNVERIISTIKVAVFPRILALIISSITLFAVVQPIFGIILLVWTIFFVFISYIVAKKSEKIVRENAEISAKLGGEMSDSVSNIVSTKLFSNITQEIFHLDKYINAMVTSDRKFLWLNLKANFIHGCFVTILIGSMLVALIHGRIHESVSPGDFALVLTLSISFIMSLEDIRQRMLEFTKAVGNCNQALSFIRVPHEITDAANALPINIKNGEIRFEHILFKHENNNNALFDKLNVTIHPGEKVGLVGYSGGGKSTFIKLILRLVEAQSGHILIDNQDIKEITKHSLRKQIGTIPQEPDLFHRTIMENIRFAKPDASDEDVIEAAKKAKCDEFISELHDKYLSLVGERGIKLSGGQKQRIAIARAFLKNAPILLLDEATSSLDSITERHIQESLHDVMAGKTTIVIAHRLSTLKDMDRILVFVSGKIVEDGDLNSLLKNKESHFHKLWQMQAEGFIPSVAEQKEKEI